jgi:hypothetical protein
LHLRDQHSAQETSRTLIEIVAFSERIGLFYHLLSTCIIDLLTKEPRASQERLSVNYRSILPEAKFPFGSVTA